MNRAPYDQPDSGQPAGQPGSAGTEQTTSAHSATDRVAEKAHHTIDNAARNVGEAERRARETAAEATARARAAEERAEATLDENIHRVKDYVERNPMASAGIAFVAGVVISGLLRR